MVYTIQKGPFTFHSFIGGYDKNITYLIQTPETERVWAVDASVSIRGLPCELKNRIAGIFITHTHGDHVAYLDQFDYPWFGGYLNVLIISGTYLFFGFIIYRAMYGKVKNPHQSYEDRKIDIQTLIRQLFSIAIAVTFYAMVQISLKAFGLESFKAITISLYFHLIGFLSMQWPRLDFINFDVYKDKPALTK